MYIFLTEIRLDSIFIQIIFFLTKLFSVIPPVPCFQFLTFSFTVHNFLQLSSFCFGILDRIFPQAIQQVKCILRVLRHVVSQLILCEIVESHQLCLFQTKSKHLFQHFLVVIGIATVTQAGICLIDILSQFTVLSILEQRSTAGFLQGKYPFTVFSMCLGFLCSPCNDCIRQTGQVFFLIYHQQIIVVVGQHMITELNGQCRKLLVDFTQTFLLLCIQSGTRTDKFLIIFIQQIMLFGGQLNLSSLFLIMNSSHSLIQLLIQENIVAVFRQHRSNLCFQRHHFVIGICFCQSKEHTAHTSQNLPAVVQRHNRIFETRFLRIFHNSLDFFILLFNTFQESRLIMFHLDTVKVRCSIRGFKLRQERIARVCRLLPAGTYHTTHSCCKN